MEFVTVLTNGLRKVLSSEKDISVLLLESLQEVLNKQIAKGLGDRTSYVGASDLNNCIRKAVLGKRHQTPIDLQKALFFIRGHLTEMIIIMALKAENVPFVYQPELIHPEKPYVKAHLDFLFENSKRVHTLDIKSGKKKNNSDMWDNQLHTQMGLVQLNHPDKQVTGSICSFDLTAGLVQHFNGFEFDAEEFAACMKRADLLWDVFHHEGTEDAHAEKSFLCDWCDFIDTCPKFSGEGLPEIPDLEPQVEAYMDAKMAHDSHKKTFEDLKTDLLEVAKGFGRKIKVGEYTVRPAQRSRRGGIDEAKLKKEKPDVHADLEAHYRKPKSRYFQLDVAEIREPKKAVREPKKAA